MIRKVGLLAGPLICTLLIIALPDAMDAGARKTLGLASWMIIWWITEAAPIPVTALLPLIVFPLTGVMKIGDAAAPYANPIIFLFMGGFLLALGLEKHRLHERIAINLIRRTGSSGNGIILGFTLATAFLSMWISNTATAMMMLPIAISVIDLLKQEHSTPLHELTRNERNFGLGLMLMIGYAATLGGMATIIGTPPNVVFVGLLNSSYGKKINFYEWMIIGVPVATALIALTYLMITRLLFPNKLQNVKGSEALLKQKLIDLGPMRKEEKLVLSIFVATSALWIFQDLLNNLANRPVLNDTNIAMLGGAAMFIVPSSFSRLKFLLEWKDTEKLHWGILLLFGGGLCLAEGLKITGIIHTIGDWIAARSSFNLSLILLLIVVSVLLSEVMSNVALVQIFVPVVFGIADSLNVNPIYLALPVTLSASIAFMFPIATPPNAIVFSSGHIRMKDMVKAGIGLNLLSVGVIWLVAVTLVKWVFH